MVRILMSACLLGHKVRYDGDDCLQSNTKLQTRAKAGNIITIALKWLEDYQPQGYPLKFKEKKKVLMY